MHRNAINGSYSLLLERGVMPILSSITRSRFWDLYRQMLRLEKQPLESLMTLQWQRLTELIAFAYDNVDLYRGLLERVGMAPGDLESPEDLERLPILTKDLIQRGFPDQVTARTSDREDWKYLSTRGTTDRLVTVQDFTKRDAVRAAAVRALRLSGGYRIGRTMVEIPPDICNVVCGDEGQEIDGVLPHLWKMLRSRQWRDPQAASDLRGLVERGWILRKKTYPPFGPRGTCLPEEELDRYVDLLRRDRPYLLKALPTYLFEIARHVQRLDQAPLDIAVVKPMGGTVSPRMRRIIERSFTGGYREDYGSAEFGDMACDCPEQQGLHLFMDLFYVEIVRNGRRVPDGEIGKVLVTDLSNRSMPMIRYQIGDVGRLETAPCRCGRESPRLLIEGRLQDTIVTDSGRVLPPDQIMDFFYSRQAIREFQLVEKRPGLVHVTIVEGEQGKLDDRELDADLQELLGEDCKIRLFRASSIKPETGGKFRFIKSSSFERLDAVGDPTAESAPEEAERSRPIESLGSSSVA